MIDKYVVQQGYGACSMSMLKNVSMCNWVRLCGMALQHEVCNTLESEWHLNKHKCYFIRAVTKPHIHACHMQALLTHPTCGDLMNDA